jgi:mannose-6-phosphate isomerase-like protein (cupin superfamily)
MSDNGQDGTPCQKFTVHPQLLESGKQSHRLARNRDISCGVQVVSKGGETNLHAHSGVDEIWYVLAGEATFYGQGHTVIAKLARNEGLLIPHGEPYWFESSQPENLVILRFGAKIPDAGPDKRIDYDERQYIIQHGVEGGIQQQVTDGMVEWPVKIAEGKFFGD